MDFGATVFGAFLATLFGYIGSIALDYRRTKQEEKTASAVIATELFRIIDWHERILALKKEKQEEFEVWGMFLPINSLGQYRVIMKKVLTQEEFKVLEDAYIRFSTLDREMQGVLQAWIANAHNHAVGPVKKWLQVFWTSVCDEETIKLVERLRLVHNKLAA